MLIPDFFFLLLFLRNCWLFHIQVCMGVMGRPCGCDDKLVKNVGRGWPVIWMTLNKWRAMQEQGICVSSELSEWLLGIMLVSVSAMKKGYVSIWQWHNCRAEWIMHLVQLKALEVSSSTIPVGMCSRHLISCCFSFHSLLFFKCPPPPSTFFFF